MSGRRQRPRVDGTITALKKRKGRSERVAVYLDGVFALELAGDIVVQAELGPGERLTAQFQEELLQRDAPYRARARSLRLLEARDRSQREVAERLQLLGFSERVVEDTLAWLRGLGYLDDSRFATKYAADRLKAGWGGRRVRAELRRRGVESGVIEDALATEGAAAEVGVEGADAVITIARRRFGSHFAVDPAAAERRLGIFLARRGYDWEEIEKVVRALREESGDPQEQRSKHS